MKTFRTGLQTSTGIVREMSGYAIANPTYLLHK